MLLNDAIRNRITYFLNKKGFSSLWELYKNCGVPKSTINALLGTEKNKLPRLPTLLHICEGLDTNLREFFDDLCLLILKISQKIKMKLNSNINLSYIILH